MDIGIFGDDGQPIPVGETGEICVRGPGVFAGYLNDPETNERVFRGGWFHTGDLGHLDDRGFVYITGRASDMYISGGSNVYPREIEEDTAHAPRRRRGGRRRSSGPQMGGDRGCGDRSACRCRV